LYGEITFLPTFGTAATFLEAPSWQVDVVLHPLKSELNFPYGPKDLVKHMGLMRVMELHEAHGRSIEIPGS